MLTAEQLGIIQQKQTNQSRINTIVGIAAARWLTSNFMGVKVENLKLRRMAHGKPYFENQSSFFNISHSAKFVAVTLSRLREVGVDIENTTDPLQISESLIEVLPFNQQQLIRNVNSEKRAMLFYKIWTANEAYLKLTGNGLSKGFSGYTLTFNDQRPSIFLKNVANQFQPIAVNQQVEKNFVVTTCCRATSLVNHIISTDVRTVIGQQ